MKKGNKFLVAFLVIALTALSLIGCGGQSQPATEAQTEAVTEAATDAAVTEAVSEAEPETPSGEGPGGPPPGEPVNVDETLSIDDAIVTDMSVKLDGEDLKITLYEDCYVLNPTNVAMIPNADGVDQKISIYVPETATKDSAIIFAVNNGGWIMDAYAMRTQIEDGGEYVSDSDNDKIGALLSRGYVMVSFGGRSRGDNPNENGEFISHSPATITDAKACIRYLRNNAETLPAGDPEKIVITGTSGGGALSTIICASGDSSDYFESLYEIGAAGINKDGDSYTSELSDGVFATIAYCPINDLRESDAAYEFTYTDVRQRLVDEGLPVVDPASGETFQDPFTDAYTPEWMMEASKALAAQYGEYVTGLGIPGVTGDNLLEVTMEELNKSLEKVSKEIGTDTMIENLASNAITELDVTTEEDGQMLAEAIANDIVGMYNTNSEDWTDFLTVEDGVAKIADLDALQQYFYFVARNQTLKVACAFSNMGLAEGGGLASVSGFNEDSLYGSKQYPYSAYEFYSWDNDAIKDNGCGLDDTGLTWDEFLKTEDGALLTAQMQMSSPIPYLTGECEGTVCENWYVRHGFRDRDTAFSLQAVLFRALENNASVKNLDTGFAWLQGHAGDYDVQEAYAWLDSIMQ